MKEQTMNYEQVYEGTRESKNGVSVRIASPKDAEGLRRMLSRASSETIYLRFHIAYVGVPGWMLGLMLGVGQRDVEALVAVAGGEVVGHAMYVGLGAGDAAEMAIIVEDEWQSQGVGKLLLLRLAERARLRGIGAFVAEVLGTNRSMLGLAAMFPETRYTTGEGVCHIRMTLGAPVSTAAVSETGQRAA